jgi:hypothetical protein
MLKVRLFLLLSLMGLMKAKASVITINTAELITASPNDGLCSLYEAVDAANNNVASGTVAGECVAGELHPVIDVIEIDESILPAYFHTVSELTLSDSVHFKGPTKELVTLTGIGLNRVFKIFNTTADAEFKITDVTFAASSIRLPDNVYGGAIWAQHFNGASLTIKRVDFIGNNAQRGGGAIGLFAGWGQTTLIEDCYFEGNFVFADDDAITGGVAGGGAIFIGAQQDVTIKNSTFVSNTASNLNTMANPLDDAAGGAILVRSSNIESYVTIEQSTFSDNIANGVGGALAFGGPGYPNEASEVTIKHSTIVSNEADHNNDQTGIDSGGGGIYSSSTTAINLFNSIVAANTDMSDDDGPDLTGSVISAGYNLIGNNKGATVAFPAGQPNINDDWVGSAAANIIPLLDTLEDNGGPTPTRMPLENSLAIDNGRCNILTADQRHQYNDQTLLRTIDQPGTPNALSGCDIGAVELGAVSNNTIPDAVDDAYNLLEGSSLILDNNQGLLNNDVDDNSIWVITAGGFNSSDDIGEVELFADGALMFTPFDDEFNGQTTFDYTITDRLNHDSATVTFTIQAVNDVPSFVATTTQVTGDPGIFTTIPWATGMSAGPANESNQSLVFVVTIINAPNGFFIGFPAIDATTGDLSFEIDTNATGQAELSVVLKDNGGTDNGGGDTSAPVNLIIQASDLIFADGFE